MSRFRRLTLAVLFCAVAGTIVPMPASQADPGSVTAAAAAQPGYWMVAADGGIFGFGDAPFYGSTGAIRLNSPIVSMTATPTGGGYWMVAADGGIFGFGDATFYGSMGATKLNSRIVSMTATPTGGGYWMVAADGGIFGFGDATFYGSMGATKLNSPIVVMAPTPTGRGYWMVAADGGVFGFGDATFYGSMGATKLNSPIVVMTPTPTGRGYWMVAADGGVFGFGDAAFLGSTGGIKLNSPIVAMAPTALGKGYWMVAADGGVFGFGDAAFLGSMGATKLNSPIVRLVAAPAPRVTRPGDGLQANLLPQSPPSTDPTPTTTGPPVVTPPPAAPSGSYQALQVQDPALRTTAPSCAPGTSVGQALAAVPNDGGENSGLAFSSRYPGIGWFIRDSGHGPSLYAMRFDGAMPVGITEFPVPGATNFDWEDLTYSTGPDGVGRLWVVESGQGGKPRHIYEIAEPNPDTDSSARMIGQYPWAYPDRKGGNTETSFWYKGKLVVVAKKNPGYVYIFDQPFTPGAVNVPRFVGKLLQSDHISVARIAADGQTLISARHDSIFIYRSADGSGSLESFLERVPVCSLISFPLDNVESGDFLPDGRIVFTSESKNSYLVTLGAP